MSCVSWQYSVFSYLQPWSHRMAEVVSCVFVWGFLLFIMRFTDKTTLTLTGTLFVPFRHVTSSIPASIVRLVYVIPLVQTRGSQTREVSAKIAMDILALHCLSVCPSVCLSVCLWQPNVLRKQRYLLQTLQNIHKDSKCIAPVRPSKRSTRILCQAVTVRCNVLLNLQKVCQAAFLVCLAVAIHNKDKQIRTKRPQRVTNNQLSLCAVKRSVVFRFYWPCLEILLEII
jgi:hypothetical protein